MVRLLVLYNKPSDIHAFEQHYREVVVLLVKKLNGLRSYTLSRNITPSGRPGQTGNDPYYMVAELDWDDMETMKNAFQSPEGQTAAAAIARLSELSPGTRSMIYELEEL